MAVGDKPHVRDLLRRVAEAGDAGLTAADLEPGRPVRTTTVNGLNALEAAGLIRWANVGRLPRRFVATADGRRRLANEQVDFGYAPGGPGAHEVRRPTPARRHRPPPRPPRVEDLIDDTDTD